MKDLKDLEAEKRGIIQELRNEPVGSHAYQYWVNQLQEKNKEIMDHPEYRKNREIKEATTCLNTPSYPSSTKANDSLRTDAT